MEAKRTMWRWLKKAIETQSGSWEVYSSLVLTEQTKQLWHLRLWRKHYRYFMMSIYIHKKHQEKCLVISNGHSSQTLLWNVNLEDKIQIIAFSEKVISTNHWKCHNWGYFQSSRLNGVLLPAVTAHCLPHRYTILSNLILYHVRNWKMQKACK